MINEPSELPRLMTDAECNGVFWKKSWLLVRALLVSAMLVPGTILMMGLCSQFWPAFFEEHDLLIGIVAVCYLIAALIVICLVWIRTYKSQNAIQLPCPWCKMDITDWYFQISKTRCCCKCGQRMMEGGNTHSYEVYLRYLPRLERRQYRFYLLGAWLVLIPWLLVCMYVPIFRDWPEVLVLVGTLGIARAVWLALKDGNRTQIPLLPMYGLVLCIGLWRWI